jgi:predicted amidohydrolase YtcJ
VVPDLGAVGRSLAALGITGVTDATPGLAAGVIRLLRGADVPQRIHLLGAPDAMAEAGPWKIHLRDHDLPHLDALAEEIAMAHRAGRGAAVHCVTATSLLLTLAALDQVGPHRLDRIEHASIVPPEVHDSMRRLGVTVVTQPGFIMARGDDYLRDLDQDEHACLYPYASLLNAGIPTVASSDAPYGPLDPWAVMRAARDRRTPSGAAVLPQERVDVRTALAGYLAPLEDPSAPPRSIKPGMEADLVLLDAPLAECLEDPDAGRVRAVWRAGRLIHGAA